ncbi:hypothetical protein RA210_U250041 [Rubrivivax sp. A210]|uniref:hypothetical protein n=1 Tax=Rubrivivax sp. A210 TaxID=2772301 RepID=UPI001919B3B9|nr:hypothetical protein [Rubrivivax sp. A210]CAD5372942.1 hypothetical protein RA210_U250041 [Rubrivivax sp. A210]
MEAITGEMLISKPGSWLSADYKVFHNELLVRWLTQQDSFGADSDEAHIAACWFVLSHGLASPPREALGLLQWAEPALRRGGETQRVGLGLNLALQARLREGSTFTQRQCSAEAVALLCHDSAVNSADAAMTLELLARGQLKEGKPLEAMQALEKLLHLHLGRLLVSRPLVVASHVELRADVLHVLETQDKDEDLQAYRSWPIAVPEATDSNPIEDSYLRACTHHKAGRMADFDREMRSCVECAFGHRKLTSEDLRRLARGLRDSPLASKAQLPSAHRPRESRAERRRKRH